MEQQQIDRFEYGDLSSSDLPSGTEVESGRRSHVDNQVHRNKTGLHYIAGPECAVSQSFDIIAIHGEGGHWASSWTHDSTRFFWLRDILPQQFPAARIYSYSPRSQLDNVAETLLYDLLDERSIENRSEVPIILLGHSLGGTLVKKLFIESSPSRNSRKEVKQLHSKIAGFVFLGTRQSGAFDNAFFKMLNPLSRIGISTVATRAENLRRSIERVPGVNHDFKLLKGERLPLACFYETEPSTYGMLIVDREQAVIDSDGLGFCENRQINKNHADLAKFEGLEDPDLRRVLGTFSRLVQHALMPRDVQMHQDQPEPQGFSITPNDASTQQALVHVETAPQHLRVLSLDGGGVRGLFTILVLEALMEEVRILTNEEDDIRPCDFFDLIGGTSTGGLLALMLSRLRMDIKSCKKQYRDLSKIIFQKQGWSYPLKTAVDAFFGRAWYPAEPLEASIKALVAERITVREKKQLRLRGQEAAEAPLRSEYVSRARCFVCAIRSGERGCARLRSYISKGGEADRICAIWQASRATSAAQLYFPPMKIGFETYWDGGSDSNNPVQETYEEVFLEFGDEAPLAGIVSIGTGMPAHQDPGTKAWAAVSSFIARATDTESIHLNFQKQHPQLKDIYFRFQGSLELGAIDLADWTKLDVIEKLAEAYLESNEGQSLIQNCARQLVR